MHYIIDFVKLRKLISAYKTKLFGQRLQQETVTLLGKTLTVSAGAIPQKADKDTAWWYALCSHYHVIYDIGSNVGYSSILACMHEPGRTILLADPNPQALGMARQNLEQNGMGAGKHYVNAFFSDKKGDTVKFYSLGAGAAGSMFGSNADSARAVNAFTDVSTTTIDEVVKETGLVPDLVKVDVEAAESLVLNGALELAVNQNVVFFVEMHGPEEMPMEKNAGLILDWCARAGYNAWYLKECFRLVEPKQIGHRGRCHLLLLPEGTEYPEYLKGINEGDGVS